jgi:hypothetical protein
VNAGLVWWTLVLIVWGTPARAGETAVLEPALQWQAPAGCPTAVDAERELGVVLGQPAAHWGPFRRVLGVIAAGTPSSPPAARWSLRLELETESRSLRRVLYASDCGDLARAAAVALVLAVGEGEAENREQSSLLPSAPRTTLVPKSETSGVVPETMRSGLWPWSLSGAAALDAGALPASALGARLQVRAGPDAWQVSAHLAVLPKQSLGLGEGRAALFGLVAGGLGACAPIVERGFTIGVCLGVEVGQLSAEGRQLRDAQRVTNLWLASALGFEGAIHLHRQLSMTVLTEALLPLVRKQYVINSGELVHRPAAADPRLSLGLRWALD